MSWLLNEFVFVKYLKLLNFEFLNGQLFCLTRLRLGLYMLLCYQFNLQVLLLITIQCTFNRPEQFMILVFDHTSYSGHRFVIFSF